MQLILCDDKQLRIYNLTNNNEGCFIIEYYYDDGLFETITLTNENDLWKIEETPSVYISEVGKSNILNLFSNSILHIASANKDIVLYLVPDIEKYVDINYGELSSITIGSNDNSNIYINYKENCNFATINKNENLFYIKCDSNVNIYKNYVKVSESQLNIGDIIFVNGIKIIWMNSFFKINNSVAGLKIKGMTLNETVKIEKSYLPTTESERYLKLYNDNQVFFHSPRLQSTIEPIEIELDSPPEANHNQRMPIIFTVGSSAILGLTSCVTAVSTYRNLMIGNTSKFDAILEFIISGFMVLTSIGIPILTNSWQKKQEKKLESNRVEKYTKYLDNKKEIINKTIKEQENILRENNVSLDEIQKRIDIGTKSLWSREIIDDDFLNLRLGTGDLPAEITIKKPSEKFFLFDDELRDKVNELYNEDRKLKNVPISISMAKNKITTFIINSDFRQEYIDSIMLQLIYYYSPLDLKLVVITDEENKDKWSYSKYLPHLWTAKRDKRLFASNDNEMTQLSLYLEHIYDKRLNENNNLNKENEKVTSDKTQIYKNFSEYYLIVTDGFKTIKNLSIVNRIINGKTNVGFSLLIFENDIKNLPSRLDKFIDIKSNVSGIYSKNLKNNDGVQFKAEYIPKINIEKYSKIISNIPIQSSNLGYMLPQTVNFLEMYHVGMIEHLNILKKWKENNPIISLNAPIGIKEGGKLIGLDLHEKVHGPHGLIAGSTGSGKSEFIITYILSMCINYSPLEVQFILIDYKGGGLAGAFENRNTNIKIPHLIGTITNLDTSEMNRTLVSIKSELQRRQREFNEARNLLGEGTIDIYKYQKLYRDGKIKKPISHLFVVCDEFAELKQQQPDFMNELISTSRIGRSLGVHLILATQKPSGIVDDQIWSNSRFKVCLKVQTSEDSMELLKRPEASEIKETGRFYLQVGNNEIFELGQSAWAGAKYTPVKHLMNKIDDSIEFINNDGSTFKSINDEVKAIDTINNGEQLTNIVKYLNNLAVIEKINPQSLWLPPLNENIYISDLVKKYNYSANRFDIKAIIGEYDKPAKQEQGLFCLDVNCKNTLIFGIPNSGKELLISNIIYSSSIYHNTDEVNFYILDFGSEALGIFNKFASVGEVITSSSKDKVISEFEYLEKEIRKRKELFSDYSGNYYEYCCKSGNSVPLIVTIINAYESFMENCSEFEDYYIHLLREGSKYGIVFVVSVVSTNSIRSSQLELYANKIVLQSNDNYDYQYILNAERGLVPKKHFGRGIAVVENEPCEFQTSLLINDGKTNELIKAMSKKFADLNYVKAPSIKKLPKCINTKDMIKYSKLIEKIPVGYTRDSVELFYYNFKKYTNHLIIGENVTDDISFLAALIDLFNSIKDVQINIFDFITAIDTDGDELYYNINFKDPFERIIKNNAMTFTINIMIGIGESENVFDNEEKILFNQIMNNINNFNNQIFVIFDNYDRFSKIFNTNYYNNINKNYGIWVGNNIENQNVFNINNMTNYDADEKMNNLIYVFDDEKYHVIKGLGDSDE